VRIHDESYSVFVNSPSYNITQLIRQVYGDKCLCCESILHPKKNWLPTNTLCDIFDEIRKLNEIKCHVKYLMTVDEISTWFHLPDDIRKTVLSFLMVFDVKKLKNL